MPNPSLQSDTYTVVASPAAAAETVIATLIGVTTEFDAQAIHLTANVNISLAAAATACILRIRRTGLTGTLCGVAGGLTGVTAGSITSISLGHDASDAPGNASGATYVLTAQCTAGATPSTVNAVHLSYRTS